MNNMKKGIVAAGVVAALASGVAFAATQNFTATATFATPLTLTKNADLDFAVLKANTAATYNLSTAGLVTAGANGEFIAGTSHAGNLTISGAANQLINISSPALSVTPNNGVNVTSVNCAYDNGAEVQGCTINGAAAPGAGKTLLVGADIDVDGSQNDGVVATPTFDVNVVYN